MRKYYIHISHVIDTFRFVDSFENIHIRRKTAQKQNLILKTGVISFVRNSTLNIDSFHLYYSVH